MMTPAATVLLLLPLLAAALTAVAPPAPTEVPTPPPETALDRSLVAAHLPTAAAASDAAEDEVFELFASPATRRFLERFDSGSGLYKLPTKKLIARFWEEMDSAELVHNFGSAAAEANCGFDLTIATGRNQTIFWNQWELQALAIVPVDAANNVFTEWSETKLFGFPPFANTSAPDMATAESRPLYAALNMFRGSGGNPQCGKVGAVLSRTLCRQQILAAPVDTGFFQGSCAAGQSGGSLGATVACRCDAWPAGNRTLGVPPHVHHLLRPFLAFWNYSEPVAGRDYPNYSLARLLVRLLSRRTYGVGDDAEPLPLGFAENALGYLELNPVVTVPLVATRGSATGSGVKMLVGMFELLWGTAEGAALRAWCVRRGWPLAWAYNPALSFFRCGPAGHFPSCVVPPNLTRGIDTASVRLLDPGVLDAVPAGRNASFDRGGARAAFATAWTRLNATSASRSEIAAAWAALSAEPAARPLSVEPLYAGACASEACIGVVVDTGACVCP